MVKKLTFAIALLLIIPQSAYAFDYMIASSPATIKNLNRVGISSIKSTIRPTLQAERQNFKQQIQAFRNSKKKIILEKVNDGITNANTNRTTQMNNSLTRFNNILSELSTKSATLKSQGKDTTALDADIATAQTAVVNAQAAVTAQKGKTYSANITDETILRSTVGQMVLQFKSDIMATYQQVLTAKQAVVAALVEFEKLNTTSGGTNVQISNQ